MLTLMPIRRVTIANVNTNNNKTNTNIDSDNIKVTMTNIETKQKVGMLECNYMDKMCQMSHWLNCTLLIIMDSM